MAAGKKAKRNDWKRLAESRRSDLDLARSEAQRLRTELRAERAKATFFETQGEVAAKARKEAEARAEALQAELAAANEYKRNYDMLRARRLGFGSRLLALVKRVGD